MTERTANPEPLPCPFCGEADPAKLVVDLDITGVICKGCQSTGPCLLDQAFESDEAAIDAATLAWNRRTRHKRQGETRLYWRGSVSDLITDLAAALDAKSLRELSTDLFHRTSHGIHCSCAGCGR